MKSNFLLFFFTFCLILGTGGLPTSTLLAQQTEEHEEDHDHSKDEADHQHDKESAHDSGHGGSSHGTKAGEHDKDGERKTGEGAHGHDHDDHHPNACGYSHSTEFDAGALAMHHIADQNIYSIGPWHIPLPCIIWKPGEGFDMFSSGRFEADAHGVGTKAYKGYVLYNGQIKRIADVAGVSQALRTESVDLGHHAVYSVEEPDPKKEGKTKGVVYLCHDGQKLLCEHKSTLDFGVFGGGLTSFHDLSITKNVVSMFLVFLLGFWLFRKVASAYAQRAGMAPKGLQSFIEPIFTFIQDEVAKPFLGHKWEKFLPFLMALFFFILLLNLWGQVPFLGGSNVTGSLSVTFVLAIFAFIVTNINGNKDYWKHIFWMPDVPAWIKPILTPVEVLGVFIKPLTLMLRLFANITAGHIVLVIFVSLIFIFSKNGLSPLGGYLTAIPASILTVFMMAIELLVAFIQAFVFTILTASYIGAAIEEHHH